MMHLQTEPFSKQPSRDYLLKISKDRFVPPPLGTYNPKGTKPSIKVWRRFDKETTKTISLNKIRDDRAAAQANLKLTIQKKEQKKLKRPQTAAPRIVDPDADSLGSIDEEFGRESVSSSFVQTKTVKKKRRRTTNVANSQKELFPPARKNVHDEYPYQHIVGHVKFDRRPYRRPLVDREIFDEEGKQFNYLDTPSVSSKYRPIRVASMKKALPRKSIFDTCDDDPDYEPNYEIRKRKVNLGIMRFDSSTGKDTSSKRSTTANEGLYKYNEYTSSNKSMIFKRTQIVNFDLNLPREFDPNSGLPSFMQTKRAVQSLSTTKKRPLTSAPRPVKKLDFV